MDCPVSCVMHVQGDSGGPVFCLTPGNSSYQLMGIVSWGFDKCRSRVAVPSVSTFVPPYLTWIEVTQNSLGEYLLTSLVGIKLLGEYLLTSLVGIKLLGE